MLSNKTNSTSMISSNIIQREDSTTEITLYQSKITIKIQIKTEAEVYYFFDKTLEEIHKIDRFFMAFGTLSEINAIINEMFQGNKSLVLRPKNCGKGDNGVDFIVILKSFLGKKDIEIALPLEKREEKQENLIKILCEKVNFLM